MKVPILKFKSDYKKYGLPQEREKLRYQECGGDTNYFLWGFVSI